MGRWLAKLGRATAAMRQGVAAFFCARANPSFFDWPSRDDDDY